MIIVCMSDPTPTRFQRSGHGLLAAMLYLVHHCVPCTWHIGDVSGGFVELIQKRASHRMQESQGKILTPAVTFWINLLLYKIVMPFVAGVLLRTWPIGFLSILLSLHCSALRKICLLDHISILALPNGVGEDSWKSLGLQGDPASSS